MVRKISIFVILLFCFSLPSWAQQSSINNQTSRKGFYLSGIGFIGSEVTETQHFSVGAGMRIGGGITENLLVYVEGQGTVIDQSALTNLLFFDGQFKGQYYIWEGLYANLGAGISVGRVQTITIILSSAKTGFGVSSGLGYEFRVGKKFFVSPEFQLRYRRISSTNYLTPDIGGQLGWHF